jgi:hypothetical protein
MQKNYLKELRVVLIDPVEDRNSKHTHLIFLHYNDDLVDIDCYEDCAFIVSVDEDHFASWVNHNWVHSYEHYIDYDPLFMHENIIEYLIDNELIKES